MAVASPNRNNEIGGRVKGEKSHMRDNRRRRGEFIIDVRVVVISCIEGRERLAKHYPGRASTKSLNLGAEFSRSCEGPHSTTKVGGNITIPGEVFSVHGEPSRHCPFRDAMGYCETFERGS